jgi:hypothetical protein
MKIEFSVSIDTSEDKGIGEELIELLSALKMRLELLNEEDENDV